MTISGSSKLLIGTLLGLLVTVTLPAESLLAAESADAGQFFAGFNAYQEQEFGTAVEKLSCFIKEHPASPLRDMTLYWLARAFYGNGDRPQAARTMARFLKEYPMHPLTGTAESELLTLATQYESEETIVGIAPPNEPPLAGTGPGGVTIQTITIKRGDTLAKLAKRYMGDNSSVRQIMRLNRIDNPDLIFIGTILRVPVTPRAR